MDVLDGLVIHLMCSYWFFNNVEDVLIKSYKREPVANNNNTVIIINKVVIQINRNTRHIK